MSVCFLIFLLSTFPQRVSVSVLYIVLYINIQALQRHNTENSKQERELCGLSPNSYIPVSVSDLLIPLIGLPILLQENTGCERY